MLDRLQIHNYALIEDRQIGFEEGFTVITGETGAGKSIILGALSMLMGEKVDSHVIRSGSESATVNASFTFGEGVDGEIRAFLAEREIELGDDGLLLSRTIRSNGRSSALLQGRMVPRSDLGELASRLFEISAQKDHLSLLKSEAQRTALDRSGECLKEKADYQKRWSELQLLKKELDERKALFEAALREEEFLRFAEEELDAIDPKEGEDEELKEEIRRLSSFEQIHEALTRCSSLLHSFESSSVLASLRGAKQELDPAAKADRSLEGFTARLEESAIEVQDIYESLRDRLSSLTFSEEELDRLQGRLAQIQRVKKKYGPSLERVLEFRVEIARKLSMREDGEIQLSRLEKRIAEQESLLLEAGEALRARRKRAAALLAGNVEKRLRTLGMKEAVFEIRFREIPPAPHGLDEISFMICANPGLDLHPIAEVASGGELSRIMLALKVTLARQDELPTLIFDEVDAGIGGAVAVSVAKELEELGRTHQVIVITHLASIASKANVHLTVSKVVEAGMSHSRIKRVEGEERVREIARMLSGESASEESLTHARLLLGGR
ncbi:MAG: DNA repair protein RecN [Spirochaetales bacterium]|nr:DNA repair protein RecN [Spirochaetales bacterium]